MTPAALPDPVRALASRLGADEQCSASSVRLTQRGVMRDRPGGRAMRFRASQTVDLRRPGFAWRASAGPFGWIRITDALQDGDARLEARLLGLVRVAAASGGAALAKGEVMRYLAELAWAPDAILANPALAWTILGPRTLRVGAGEGAARGEVVLHLDADGRIAGATAEDRPRMEGGRFVERPWRGRFWQFRQHAGRWLPFAGEVGWILDGEGFTAWNGELLGWAAS